MANGGSFAMGTAIAVRADFSSQKLRRLATRVRDAAQARRLLAIAAVLDGAARERRRRSADPARLGDPVQRSGAGRPDQQIVAGRAGQAEQRAQGVSRPPGGGRADPGDPWGGALAGLRPDYAASRGVRHLGLRRHALPCFEGAGFLACERPAEGLQAGPRSHGSVQKNFPARVAEVRAKLAPGTPIEVWCQDEMRVGQKNKLTYRWARKGSRP